MLHAEYVYKSGPTSYFKRLSSISTQGWLKGTNETGLVDQAAAGHPYRLKTVAGKQKKMIWMKCSSEIVNS